MLGRVAFALVAASVATVNAFYIPADLPEGVYAAWHGARGEDLYALISPREPTRTQEKRAPQASSTFIAGSGSGVSTGTGSGSSTEYPFEIYCGCGFPVTPSDCDTAVANLEAQFTTGGSFVAAYTAWFSIANGVVAFACNDNNAAYFMTSDVFAFAAEEITSACGRYIAGTFSLEGMDSGYMQYYSGLNFCANAEESSQHTC